MLKELRQWKLRTFPDWLWDLLVGAACGVVGLLGLLVHASWLVIVFPAAFTVWNQFYNKLFEPKDFALRMAVPVVIYLVIILILK